MPEQFSKDFLAAPFLSAVERRTAEFINSGKNAKEISQVFGYSEPSTIRRKISRLKRLFIIFSSEK
jgi:hypothetical protein